MVIRILHTTQHFAFILMLVLLSCAKDPLSENKTNTEYPGANIFLVQPDQLRLFSDADQLSRGVFVYQRLQESSLPEVGDILVSVSDGGYFREITGTIITKDLLHLETKRASIGQVRQGLVLSIPYDKSIPFTLPIANGVETDQYSLVTLKDIQDQFLTVSGDSILVTGNISADFDIRNSSVFESHINADSLGLSGNLTLIIDSHLPNLDADIELLLTTISRSQIISPENLDFPLISTQEIDVVLTASLSADNPVKDTLSLVLGHKATFTARYSKGEWESSYHPESLHRKVDYHGEKGNFKWQISIEPRLRLKIFDETILNVTSDCPLRFEGIQSNEGDWFSQGQLKKRLRVYGLFLIVDPSTKLLAVDKISDPLTLWQSPASIQLQSGNGQTGLDGQALAQPIIVQVRDHNNLPIPEALVRFRVVEGRESYFISDTARTDAEGIAQSYWVMGREKVHEALIYTSRRGTWASASVDIQAISNYDYSEPLSTNDGWETATLAEVGLNETPFVNAIQHIRDEEYRNVHGIVIIKENRLVLETYFSGMAFLGGWTKFDREIIHNQASCTKSYTSALIGIAIDQGLINSENDPVMPYLPTYAHLANKGREDITLRHLLMMASGLQWDEWTCSYFDDCNDAHYLFHQTDPIGYILEKPLVEPPGTNWHYSGGNTNVLGQIIRNTSGSRFRDYANQYLFGPLGIQDYWWHLLPNDQALVSGDLKVRPRDMAKFGQLFMDKGRWKGQQIVSERWVTASTQISIPTSIAGWGYGYQWWRHEYSAGERSYRAFAARGWGGQEIIVFPDYDMIVVFTGGNYDGNVPNESLLTKYILRAIKN